jgi:acyl phosphate:glycerol-3-phosphate acyltransferase
MAGIPKDRRQQGRNMRRLAPILIATGTGYLAGTIPSADLAARLATRNQVSLRTAGSGNPGALNAAKVLGRRWGLAVLAADMAKGAAAGVIGRLLAGPAGAYAAATAAIAGHIAPVWTRGRGGKGVATSAGACAAVFPAYFPIDATVAGIAAAAGRDAERAVQISSAAWVVASLLWWRRRLPNAWGPEPTVGLPLFAVAGSAMILAKFRSTRPAS